MPSSAELSSLLEFQPPKSRQVFCTRDGKRPDGLSLISLQNGKPLAWDVTVGAMLVESYVEAAARESGAVAEQAAQKSGKIQGCVP